MKTMENHGSFTVTADITYYPNRIPPRCRKPRPVPENFTHHVSIPTVSQDDAPVALRLPEDTFGFDSPKGAGAELRTWKDALYRPVTDRSTDKFTIVTVGSRHLPEHRTENYSWIHDRWEAAERFESSIGDLLIIDGEAWELAKEPVYRIFTFGWGGGTGTSLSIIHSSDGLNPASCFSLLEREIAIEEAVKTAKGRGDHSHVDRLMDAPAAEIFIPTALTYPTRAMHHAHAATEIRALVNGADALMFGEFSRSDVDAAIKKLEKARELFWEHGLETIARN